MLKGTIKLEKNDLLKIGGSRKEFYKLLEWFYLKMDADNKRA
ncbi:hypothetical protein [Helicobacter pylori]|nr:hypothetical protein [Helicobacter pylori]